MKKKLLIGVLMLSLFPTIGLTQCDKTFELCKKQLSKADKKENWLLNEQSLAEAVEKGTNYEATLMSYKGFEYRLSLCTDINGGTAVPFQLAHDVVVAVTDSLGNTSMEKQRKVIFDNTTNSDELYVIFSSRKTEKFYLTVSVPGGGESKSLKNSDKVCLGGLLEQRRVKNSSL